MKPLTKKRATADRQANKERKANRELVQTCQVCAQRPAVATHEIARGAGRAEALKHREAQLYVCRDCHEALDDYSRYPVSKQLAIKLLADPKFFDPQLVNELRGRAPGAIDLGDIVRHLELKHAACK